MGTAANLAPDQSCAFERADMLGRGGEGHGEGLCQLPDRPLTFGQLSKHLAARRIAKGVEDGVQLGRIMFNHVVKFRRIEKNVNPLVEYYLSGYGRSRGEALIAMALASALLMAEPAVPSPMVVVAHRGRSGGGPENTLAAVRQSIERGLRIIEVDVRLTKDRQLVIVHDDRLDRTSDCSGRVSDLTLVQVRRCDAGWPTHPGELVPTFAEVLVLAQERSVRVLADVKETSALEPLLATIREHRADGLVILGLRRTDQVAQARKRFPGIVILANMPGRTDAAAFAKAGAQIVRLWSDWVEADPSQVRSTRAQGPHVWVMVGRRLPSTNQGWRELHGRMIGAGAEGLITDHPELVPEP